MIRELLTDKNNTTMFNDRDKEKLAFLACDQSIAHGTSSSSPSLYQYRGGGGGGATSYSTPLSSGSPRSRPAMKSIRERSTSMSDDMSMYDKTGDDLISRDSG